MDNKGKEGSLLVIFTIMLISLGIAFLWPKVSWIRSPIHAILDPTLGVLLQWNVTVGMILITVLISFFTVLVQKYTTDQETIRDLKKQQKEISKEAKKFAHDKDKMAEIQKEIFPISKKLMKLSIRPIMFTGIPLILFFRWFMDTFSSMGDPKFFGFLSWFWFYLIFIMVFSAIFRKILKVA